MLDPAGHAAHGGATDPVMGWVATTLNPWLAAAAPWLHALPADGLRWTLMVVTIAVMGWAGGRFYVNGVRACGTACPT